VWQTDRHTDGIAIAYTRYSIYAVARKNDNSLWFCLRPDWNFKFHLCLASRYCIFWCRTLSINIGHDNCVFIGTACPPWCGNGHFPCVKCYIFVHFPSTPNSNLNLTISLESQWNIDSNYILSVRKYCQLFTHESNTFLDEQYVIPPLQTNGAQMPKNTRNDARNSPFPCSTWTLIHQCLGWAHPTHRPKRQLDRCTHFRTTTQQSPHWLQWDAPNSPPKLPIPLRRSPLKSNTLIPRPTPLTIPNGTRL